MYDEMPEADAAPEVAPADMLAAILQAGNVAELLTPEKLGEIADTALREHDLDAASMKPWLDRMERAVALATLIKEEKNYPFEKAANVKYPLITTAALQFNARAYPAIVPPAEPVKARVHGRDPSGAKAAKADRATAFMSWQLLSQMPEWEESTDELLTTLPIVGTVVRKVWFDPALGRPRMRLVKPDAFVINAQVRVLSDAPRMGEILPLYPSEVRERINSGWFAPGDYIEQDGEDSDAPQEFIEQHRRIDLDGDGYGEPYIVTFHRKSRKIARIVADFGPEDVRTDGAGNVVSIRRGSYFVVYRLLPSLDGGFFGTGLGYLLADISESINSIINMMMDAGHMASRGGGFIGSEFRIKGGSQQFRPGEWKLVNAAGADVRSAMVPVTFPGPDGTLFQLLGLLIEAGREVASVKDILTGETGGKTMTATTTLALIEQGMAVFTAAYKRIFRSLKDEFRLLARINAENLDPAEYAAFHDLPPMMGPMGEPMPAQIDPAQDFDMRGMDFEPVADPRSVTRMQETAKAQVLLQMAEAGMVDSAEAVRRILEAASIADVEALLPRPDPAAMQAQQEQQALAKRAAQADIAQKEARATKDNASAARDVAEVQIKRSEKQVELLNAAIGFLSGTGQPVG